MSPDDLFDKLMSRYDRTGQPLTVSFRQMMAGQSSLPLAPHLLHPYPAKVLPQIPRFFLSLSALSSEGSLVLDPFSGSGTVLLESLLADRRAIGADSNPLARLIALVKTTPISSADIQHARELVRRRLSSHGVLPNPPDVVNLSYWFYPHVIRQLTLLSSALYDLPPGIARDFLLVCFSDCLRKVSLADPRVSVPVRLNPSRYRRNHWLYELATARLASLRRLNVSKLFFSIVTVNEQRLSTLAPCPAWGRRHVEALYEDARDLTLPGPSGGRQQPADTVDLVITSPPYAGAQKYIRASSLSLGWLRLVPSRGLRGEEGKTIGREHYRKGEHEKYSRTGVAAADQLLEEVHRTHPLRAHIMSTYLQEMYDALTETARVLKPNAHLILVMGENTVCGSRFPTPDLVTLLANSLGFDVILKLTDAIRAHGLMTKRHRTAGVISREHVICLRKGMQLGP